jgi:hypothetical protein
MANHNTSPRCYTGVLRHTISGQETLYPELTLTQALREIGRLQREQGPQWTAEIRRGRTVVRHRLPSQRYWKS